MGNFYTNYTVRGVSQAEVAAAMAGRSAVIAPPSNGAIVIFDCASEQKESAASELAAKLSNDLKQPVLAVMNHDDDVLWYQLYSAGKLLDQYNSCPDYFDYMGEGEMAGPKGGNARVLCEAFGCEHVDYVEQILRKPGLHADGYPFAFQRHADLLEALDLPSFAAGTSFESFRHQGSIEGLPTGEIVRT